MTEKRTATTSTFANPDGSWTLRTYDQPVFVHTANGWQDIDTALVKDANGRWKGKATSGGAEIGDSGRLNAAAQAHVIGTVDVGSGVTVRVASADDLSNPRASGSRVTFGSTAAPANAEATVLSNGLEVGQVLNVAPADGYATSFLVDGGTGISFVAARGGVDIVSDRFGVVGTIAAPVLFDAQRDASGRPSNFGQAGISLSSGPGGSTRVTVTPDPGFLSAKTTQYPVSIDPSIASADAWQDTYIAQSDGSTHVSRESLGYLGVGNLATNGTANPGRIFTKMNPLPTVPTTPVGAVYQGATLWMWDLTSGSPSGSQLDLYRVDGGWDQSTINWNGAAGISYTNLNTAQTPTFNTNTCGGPPQNSWVGWDITSTMIYWWGGGTNQGFMVRAHNEAVTSQDTQHYFESKEAACGHDHIDVVYDYPPGLGPISPVIQDTTTSPASVSPNVTFTASTTDPDGAGDVQTITWWLKSPDGSVTYSTGTTSGAAGAAQSWQPLNANVQPYLPVNGQQYLVQARTADQGALTSGIVSAGPYLIDGVNPTGLTGTSAQFQQNGVTSGTSVSGSFTFSTASTDTASFQWGLNNAAMPNSQSAYQGYTTNPVVSLTGVTQGVYTMYYQATDRVGNVAKGQYVFSVGAGLVKPPPGARTQATLPVQAHDDDSAAVTAEYQWRAGTSASTPWVDIPAADLTPGNPKQGRCTAGPGCNSGDFTQVVWNVAATLGAQAPNQTVQVRVQFLNSSNAVISAETSAPTDVAWAIHSFGAAAATTSVGPGTLALQTGDYSIGATDVSESTYRGSLSAGRSFDTLSVNPAGDGAVEMLHPDQRDFETPASGGTAAVALTNAGGGFTTNSIALTGTQSVIIAPSGSAQDNFASYNTEGGGDVGGMREGMLPGHTYSFTGWAYDSSVPLSVESTFPRALRLAAFWKNPGSCASYCELESNAITALGAWQRLQVTFTLPSDATEAFVRLYNGGTAPGQNLFYDAMSLQDVSPLGYGWSLAAQGPDAGYSTETPAVDAANGLITFTDTSDGSSEYFIDDGTATSTFTPDGFDVPNGDKAVYSSSAGTVTRYGSDGSVTTWQSSGGGPFLIKSVTEPAATSGASGTGAQFHFNSWGRVDEVLAGAPPGVSCGTPNGNSASLVSGCRALFFDYSTGSTTWNTGTPDQLGFWFNNLQDIRFAGGTTGSPDTRTSGVQTVTLVNYWYDQFDHLRQVVDDKTGLITSYTYSDTTPNGRVASVAPPGIQPTSFVYDGSGRLSAVKQLQTDGVTYATTTVAYGAPLDPGACATSTSLPDLDGYGVAHSCSGAHAPADWNEVNQIPYGTGTAIFRPDHVPSGSPTSTDWPYASISYRDALGRPVNGASYGAGAWQVTTSQYDVTGQGNVVFQLSARGRNEALAPDSNTDSWASSLTSSQSRAQLLGTQTIYSQDGSEVLDTYGPVHTVVKADGSAQVHARLQVHTDYDQGAPNNDHDSSNNNQPFRLPTGSTSSSCIMQSGTICTTSSVAADTRSSTTKYDPVIGGTSGWTLHMPTQTVTPVDANASNNVVHSTAYDSLGHATLTEDPKATVTGGGDNTAHSTLTWYYAACDDSLAHGYQSCSVAGVSPSPPSTCQSHSAWAGLVCQSAPQHQPAIIDANHPALTTSTTTGYNLFYQPTGSSETNGTVTRTTTTNYDSAYRPSQVTTTTAGDSSTAISAQYYGYNTANGLVGCVSTASGCTPPSSTACATPTSTTIFTSFDSLGRTTCVSDASGATASSSYDIDNRTYQATDAKGTATYTYDGTDQLGNVEHRGLLTSMTDGLGSNPDGFIGAYNADGQLVSEKYPNNLVVSDAYDDSGYDTQRWDTFWGTCKCWYYNASPNIFGQDTWGSDIAHDDSYSYDGVGRLTAVNDQDHTSTSGAPALLRRYVYDRDSNRTAVTLDQSYHGQVLANAPSAYYRLDEASGTSASDGSGNGHGGTYSSAGVTYATAGATPNDTNKAVTLNGSTGSVTAPGASWNENNSTFSYEIWFKVPSNEASSPDLLGEGPATDHTNSWQLYVFKGGDGLDHLGYSGQGVTTDGAAAVALDTAAWHQGVVTYDGTTLTLYVDGQQVRTLSTALAHNTSTSSWSVGSSGSGTAFFNGAIDEVSAYGSALSYATVQGHYQAALNGRRVQTHSYDEADRLVSSSTDGNTDTATTYDGLGRTTAVTAQDSGRALNLGGTSGLSGQSGAVTAGYYANDLARTTAQGGSTITYCLDPLHRISTSYTSAASSCASPGTSSVQHYAGSGASGSESADWVANSDGTWSRNVLDLAGDLAGTQTGTASGTAVLNVLNLHGDVVATIADNTSAGPSAFSSRDEFGNQYPTSQAAASVGPDGYGWLGAKRRDADALGNLTLMGERLYNPATGRFLQTDPVAGGSCNSYDYTCQDPENAVDLDGRVSCPFGICGKVVGAVKTVVHETKKHVTGILTGIGCVGGIALAPETFGASGALAAGACATAIGVNVASKKNPSATSRSAGGAAINCGYSLLRLIDPVDEVLAAFNCVSAASLATADILSSNKKKSATKATSRTLAM